MTCKMCGICCRNYPCPLEPKDLPNIAEFLNITIEKLISDYLILDYWVSEEGSDYYFCPKRISDSQFDIIASFSWAFSDEPCIFLENNKCKIHKIKPRGGREMNCEDKTTKTYSKYEAGQKWIGNKYLEAI